MSIIGQGTSPQRIGLQFRPGDLSFPFSEFSALSGSQLQKTIEAELRQCGLQVTPFTVTKVIQLYETKNSRHSTMIVGKTGSGKTVTWRTLQSTLTTLHRKGDPAYNVVRVSPPLAPRGQQNPQRSGPGCRPRGRRTWGIVLECSTFLWFTELVW